MHPDIEKAMKKSFEEMSLRDYRSYMTIAKYTPKDIAGWLHAEGGMIGQTNAVNAVSSVIYSHFHFPLRPKRNLLLIGRTGCGKSELMRACQRFFASALNPKIAEKMITCVDSTQLNAVGWRGGVKLCDILKDSSTENQLPYGKLIFFDEFDKLCETRWAGGGNGSSWSVNHMIQEQLLTMLDHQLLQLSNEDGTQHFTVDTQRLSIVCMGAFSSIREQKQKTHRSIGFSAVDCTNATADSSEITTALEQYGVMTEVCGRLDPIEMTDVTDEMMYNIAVKTVKELNNAGKDLYTVSVPEQKLHALAATAISKGLGGRYIRNTLNRLFDEAVFENPCRDEFVL